MREVQEMMIDGNGAPAMLKAYDVAIIGGGIAGLVNALELQLENVSPFAMV